MNLRNSCASLIKCYNFRLDFGGYGGYLADKFLIKRKQHYAKRKHTMVASQAIQIKNGMGAARFLFRMFVQ